MTGESTRLSRRRVLAAIGGIGATSGVAGAGTAAYFADAKRVTNGLETGSVAIAIDCDSCSFVDDQVSFAVDGIDRGESGSVAVSISVETNPARLWLRSLCPPTDDPLGTALEAVFSVDGDPIASGSLSDVSRALATGRRVDTGCTTPGEGIELELDWKLPADVSLAVAGETATFTVELVAEQCRHVEEADVIDPFAGVAPCEVSPECVSCPEDDGERVASATFEYDGPGGDVELELRRGQGSAEGTRTVAPGSQFTAVFHDPPSIQGDADFDVIIDDTTVGAFHISCSRPFGPGLVIGDGTHTLTVLEAFDTDGRSLCGVTQ